MLTARPESQSVGDGTESAEQHLRAANDVERRSDPSVARFVSREGVPVATLTRPAEQVKTWRTKYEALAKLYSQLRQEHLDLLQKFKQVQLKASSAQEAIDKREKLEREMKTKNLELADLIRERDRALHEKDRMVGVRAHFFRVPMSLLTVCTRATGRRSRS